VSIVCRQLAAADRPSWELLYRGYAGFYEAATPDLELLWTWIDDGVMTCLVAEFDGKIVGFAHVREFVRPLHGVLAGFLDDLYVDPSARGQGVGRALVGSVGDLAKECDWAVVRWMTAESNVIAQRLYDDVATRVAGWLTYDMDPDAL
jgi:GNAT superfamily N-acetyltransferase